jgi:hypothetical protein
MTMDELSQGLQADHEDVNVRDSAGGVSDALLVEARTITVRARSHRRNPR